MNIVNTFLLISVLCTTTHAVFSAPPSVTGWRSIIENCMPLLHQLNDCEVECVKQTDNTPMEKKRLLLLNRDLNVQYGELLHLLSRAVVADWLPAPAETPRIWLIEKPRRGIFITELWCQQKNFSHCYSITEHKKKFLTAIREITRDLWWDDISSDDTFLRVQKININPVSDSAEIELFTYLIEHFCTGMPGRVIADLEDSVFTIAIERSAVPAFEDFFGMDFLTDPAYANMHVAASPAGLPTECLGYATDDGTDTTYDNDTETT